MSRNSVDWPHCQRRLEQGLAELSLPAAMGGPAIEYLKEMQRWNRRHNLTAVRDPLDMVSRHLIDSLVVLPWLQGARIVDVGSGAGLPGIPIAMARDDLSVTLVESNGKKASFLRHVVRSLDLQTVAVVESRAESFAPPVPFDTVVSRAVASLAVLIQWCAPLCTENGRLVVMKGKRPDEELASLPEGWAARTEPVAVPGLDESRHVIVLERI